MRFWCSWWRAGGSASDSFGLGSILIVAGVCAVTAGEKRRAYCAATGSTYGLPPRYGRGQRDNATDPAQGQAQGLGPWYGTTRNPRSRGSRSDSGPGWYSTGTNAAPRNERSGAGSLRRYSTVLGSRSGPVERRPRPTVRVGRRVVRRKYGRRDRPAPGTGPRRAAPARVHGISISLSHMHTRFGSVH